ncbi:MerR family transcriptional regulator [Bacillus sp. AFS055030]|uniref:MerR family transcriptional regulator n=1 Tax=Bacillus sp. AFS055030 TaxID=2033507 RepID=UPI000BFB28E6|nr:MerR family transcriptional regulator [Bacillus sp. AFS055030]PGL69055.1 MerR family transcriptional regulator [Bacillus sp. AFS055030]
MYSIGEVARMLRISTHTLRYYEKEQIIFPDRNVNGERLYTKSHIQWLKFVLKLKETQMPVNKIKEYAKLYTEGEHTSLARLDLLVEHKQSIENQLKTLEETNKMLEQKINFYKEVIHNKKIVHK